MQVLRNLVSNAIKFSPKGKTVTICAYFRPDADAGGVPSLAGGTSRGTDAAGDLEAGGLAPHGEAAVHGAFVIDVLDEGAGISPVGSR